MSKDTIYRQAAIDAMAELQGRASAKGVLIGIHRAWEAIKALPTAQPQRMRGRWIRTRTMEHDGELYCDQCGQEHPEQKIIWNFCPNCGADMREGEQEDEIHSDI